MHPTEPVFDWRRKAARGHAPTAVEAALLRIVGDIVHNRRAGHASLVLVEWMLEESRGATAISGHQVLADQAARVGEPIREALRARQQ